MAEYSPHDISERLRQAKEEGEKERLESGTPATPEESADLLEKAKEAGEELKEKKAEVVKAEETQIKEVRQDIDSIPSVEMPGDEFDPDQVEDEEQDYRDLMDSKGILGKVGLWTSHNYKKGKEKLGKAVDSNAGQAGLGVIGGAALVLGATGYVAWKIFKNVLWDPTAGQFLNEPLKKIFGNKGK